jgi:hypothetical protein
VTDLSKETTVQRVRRLTTLETLRRVQVGLLKVPFGEVPATIRTDIENCEDADKLEDALGRVHTLKSLDEFRL